MATGAAEKFAGALGESADAVLGVATTGVAGPDPQDGKPVGLAYVALALGARIEVHELQLEGDRAAIRDSVTRQALGLILEFLGVQEVHSEL
jgi:nicotinamide-nucleotide amidase